MSEPQLDELAEFWKKVRPLPESESLRLAYRELHIMRQEKRRDHRRRDRPSYRSLPATGADL